MPEEATTTRHLSGPEGGPGGGPAGGTGGGPAAGAGAVAGAIPPGRRRRVFAHREESVAQARHFAERALTGWELTDRLDDIRLCLSEVVTNALLHVPERRGEPAGVTVSLVRDALGVLVEVRDGGAGRPARRSPAPDDTCGRGLLLVAALTDAWGVRAEPGAKTVWLRFHCAARPRGAAADGPAGRDKEGETGQAEHG